MAQPPIDDLITARLIDRIRDADLALLEFQNDRVAMGELTDTHEFSIAGLDSERDGMRDYLRSFAATHTEQTTLVFAPACYYHILLDPLYPRPLAWYHVDGVSARFALRLFLEHRQSNFLLESCATLNCGATCRPPQSPDLRISEPMRQFFLWQVLARYVPWMRAKPGSHGTLTESSVIGDTPP